MDSPNWQTSAKKFATTALVVAIALYVAIRLLEAVGTELIIVAGIGTFAYVILLVVRYRRSQW
jgi:hypothetical protein